MRIFNTRESTVKRSYKIFSTASRKQVGAIAVVCYMCTNSTKLLIEHSPSGTLGILQEFR